MVLLQFLYYAVHIQLNFALICQKDLYGCITNQMQRTAINYGSVLKSSAAADLSRL